MLKFRSPYVLAALITGLLAAAPGCKQAPEPEDIEESRNLPPLSVIGVAQPRAERQLLEGFWAVENHGWRWTQHNFAVSLMAPPGASQRGATLQFHFALPAGLIARQKAITVTATIGHLTLPPQTYSTPGANTYSRDIPATAFTEGTPVRVAFATDKFFKAGEIDGRELALVSSSFGLVTK